MTRQDIEKKVTDILVDKLGVGPEEVKIEAGFREDLGGDSLDLVVVVMELVATEGSDGVEAMVRSIREGTSRSNERASEVVVGIVHTVAAHDGTEAAPVKSLVVRHERESRNERFYLVPDSRKHGRFLRVGTCEAVHPGVPVEVVVGLGLDERVEASSLVAAAHDDEADAADAGAFGVGGLEVYGGKVGQ